MSDKTELNKNNIFVITNYFYYLFMGNLFFILLNIPLLLLAIKINYSGMVQVSLLEIFLCCVPIGPAFTALLGVMGKLVREKDVNIIKDYFRMYKMNFKQSIILWMMQLTILIILYVDIKTIKTELLFLFLFLFIFVLITGFYMFPMVSRFYLKTNEVIIMSVVNVFKEIKTTFVIIITLLLSSMIFKIAPGIVVLFIVSLICFSVMYFENGLLKTIEDKISQRKEINYRGAEKIK